MEETTVLNEEVDQLEQSQYREAKLHILRKDQCPQICEMKQVVFSRDIREDSQQNELDETLLNE